MKCGKYLDRIGFKCCSYSDLSFGWKVSQDDLSGSYFFLLYNHIVWGWEVPPLLSIFTRTFLLQRYNTRNCLFSPKWGVARTAPKFLLPPSPSPRTQRLERSDRKADVSPAPRIQLQVQGCDNTGWGRCLLWLICWKAEKGCWDMCSPVSPSHPNQLLEANMTSLLVVYWIRSNQFSFLKFLNQSACHKVSFPALTTTETQTWEQGCVRTEWRGLSGGCRIHFGHKTNELLSEREIWVMKSAS